MNVIKIDADSNYHCLLVLFLRSIINGTVHITYRQYTEQFIKIIADLKFKKAQKTKLPAIVSCLSVYTNEALQYRVAQKSCCIMAAPGVSQIIIIVHTTVIYLCFV